jgi:methionyl-tRNA formyltransferase
MRIVFFGTPDFAIPSLKILNESVHEIVGVVTAPDKPKGRGRKLSFTPVKEYAVENNIEILTPDKLKSKEFEIQLRSLRADLFVIVAFRILPENIFTIPPKGSFNLHGSLLPKYRGAAPIQWAIINGETETGLTTFFLKKKVDTGNIILKEKIKIAPNDNFGTLHDKMSGKGAELVLNTVDLIESNKAEIQEQDDSIATPAPKITKEICRIDWNRSAEQIHNLVRGLSPFPGAYFDFNGKSYKVLAAHPVEDKKLNPSEILETKSRIFIGTAENALEILQIQPEGRKRMSSADFLRGYSLTN